MDVTILTIALIAALFVIWQRTRPVAYTYGDVFATFEVVLDVIDFSIEPGINIKGSGSTTVAVLLPSVAGRMADYQSVDMARVESWPTNASQKLDPERIFEFDHERVFEFRLEAESRPGIFDSVDETEIDASP